MKKILLIPFVFLIFAFNCKKKNKPHETEPLPIEEKQDSIGFMFINRIGYKNDSVNIGDGTMRYFFGLSIETGYYNIKTNKSVINGIAYGRDPGNLFVLRDSIKQDSYPCFVNSQYNLKVYLAWNTIKGKVVTRVRNLTYQLNIYGNDTIKTKGNKIVKFVWPDDSASGRFTKTYDGP